MASPAVNGIGGSCGVPASGDAGDDGDRQQGEAEGGQHRPLQHVGDGLADGVAEVERRRGEIARERDIEFDPSFVVLNQPDRRPDRQADGLFDLGGLLGRRRLHGKIADVEPEHARELAGVGRRVGIDLEAAALEVEPGGAQRVRRQRRQLQLLNPNGQGEIGLFGDG